MMADRLSARASGGGGAPRFATRGPQRAEHAAHAATPVAACLAEDPAALARPPHHPPRDLSTTTTRPPARRALRPGVGAAVCSRTLIRSCAWRGRWRRRSLEANQQLAALVERQREENARLREELAVRDGELERVNAELAVLKRMLFGRSSERARPGTGGDDGEAQARPGGGGKTGTRGPGARAAVGIIPTWSAPATTDAGPSTPSAMP
jgi:hypothetical protein